MQSGAQAAPRCADLFKITSAQHTWNFMQQTDSAVVAPQLASPLHTVLPELSLAKRIRLKWLLKRTKPEVDFVNERNVDAFVTSFLQIITPRIFDGPRTDEKILAIKRGAINQIIRTNVLALSKSRQAVDPSAVLKTKQWISVIRKHPLVMSVVLWQIPHIRSLNLPNNLVDVVLKGRLTDVLTATEEALANKQINIEQYRKVRSAANFVLLGVGAAFTYNFASNLFDKYDQLMQKEAEEYARKREEKKQLELQNSAKELQQIQSEKNFLESNPVAFYEELMLEDHVKQTGRQPSATDRAEIHEIAVQQAAERTKSQAM
jgi:hypothetical protein